MSAVEDILRRAKRLRRGELARLIKQLDQHMSSAANGRGSARKKRPEGKRTRQQSSVTRKARRRRKVSYAGLLAWAGTAHSDYTDVSTKKGKHLAEVYATRHE